MTMQDAATPHPNRMSPESARRRRPRVLALAFGTVALAIGLIAPATTFAATPTAVSTDGSSATACTAGAWPAAVQGMPAIHAGSAAGDYLWHDAAGWHLRVTHVGTAGVTFSGTIRANQKLHVTGFRLERGDAFTVSADGLSVSYRFVNHGALDGLNFTTACATRLGVSGRMSGALLPVRRIWVGHFGRHPLQNPFVILRRA
jgi:hypothetical protein